MAHVFLKAEVIAKTALGLLQREIVLPRVVRTWTSSDFIGAKNDTVNVPIRATLSARELALRATTRTIIADDLTESSTPITLTKMPYSAVFVTDEQLTLDIESFGEEVLTPQVRAVAEKLELYIYNEISNEANYLDGKNLLKWTTGTTDAFTQLVRLRRILNTSNISSAGRTILAGPAAEEKILTDAKFIPTAASGGFGTNSSALAEASIGRLAGFDVVVSNLIGDTEMYALTPEAFVFANLAPVVPDGVTYGKTVGSEGFSMRWIRDYDPTALTDRSVISTFAGTASINDGTVPAGYTAPTGASSARATAGSENKVAGGKYNCRAVKVVVS